MTPAVKSMSTVIQKCYTVPVPRFMHSLWHLCTSQNILTVNGNMVHMFSHVKHHIAVGQCHGWGTTQRREWILDELRNRFCTIFATDYWHLPLAIRYLHALVQEDPYICNRGVIYTLVRWYLMESRHKCSRMCVWRDVDMQRIIGEPEIGVTDYLRQCNRLLTNG